MTGESRPFLALGAPEVGVRDKGPSRPMPVLVKPAPGKQSARISPQFKALVQAFDNQRAALAGDQPGEVDPELVLVFDLAGSVEHFRNAVGKVGLEFLVEHLDEDIEPTDDFYMHDRRKGRRDSAVQHSLYAVMSNAEAARQLVRLFDLWVADKDVKFEHGLGRFKQVFEQLQSLRRWGPTDRVRETGLLDKWNETLQVAGGAHSTVVVEIELWFRQSVDARATAETGLRGVIAAAGGLVLDQSTIAEVSYHALLVQLPIQQVRTVLSQGLDSIQLLNADEIMFISPYSPMSVGLETSSPFPDPEATATTPAQGRPRIALFDGLPLVNHDRLRGRLTVDDPESVGGGYAVASRRHGTAMASLIVHGDLSGQPEPISRPLYVRPIMRPHEFFPDQEHVINNKLFTDLLHRAIRRMVDGEGGRDAAAPSVRIVNLSIGSESRAFIRRVSPTGRLLDWLAVKYNLLFIVSAGNHLGVPLTLPATAATNLDQARVEAVKSAHRTSRVRGVLPPGDAINVLTVGTIHADSAGDITPSDTAWDVVEPGTPALYGGVGPGFGRSVKPEVYFDGGRALYTRPVVVDDVTDFDLELASTSTSGPGVLVAAPGYGGSTGELSFTHGTSNARALVTREADRLFDLLEQGGDDQEGFDFPDPLYHPVLTKALLVQAASWGAYGERVRRLLNLDSAKAKRDLTALLGYGRLDAARVANAATNRAVLVAGATIQRDQRHTYRVPLPASLLSKAEQHRFTVTLAAFVPTVGHLNKYRTAKVFFHALDPKEVGGTRAEAEHNVVRNGACQHEIFDGRDALSFEENGTFAVHVECMKHAQPMKADATIRYGLVVSVETAVTTSQTIHDEIRAGLQAQARTQARERVQPR